MSPAYAKKINFKFFYDLLEYRQNMLKIKDLQISLGEKKILQGIDLQINAGEVHIVLGPNGSGKSTLGRALLGDPAYQKTSGKIFYKKKDWENLKPFERALEGFFLTFQAPPEIDGVSVLDFLFTAKKTLQPDFRSRFRFQKELEVVFKRLRLPSEFINREINKGFSGGERKKIEVASLLILKPELAFLDEIDSGVDVDTLRKIGTALNDFMAEDSEKNPRSLIIVTHSDRLLEAVKPTHAHVFSDGKIIQSGDKKLIKKIQKEGFDELIKIPKQGGLRVIS